MMKILLAHNYYQVRGGEDTVFEAEADMLMRSGFHVLRYAVHNDDVKHVPAMTLALRSLYNTQSYREISTIITRERPDIIHCHNTLPIISPSIFFAAERHGVPIVQTLHNYRLLCANALFFREGRICEECLGKSFPLQGIRHACYRDSVSATAVVTLQTALHRALGTWKKRVSHFIVLTEFAKQKMIEGGLPAEKISVKPNFVEYDPLALPLRGSEEYTRFAKHPYLMFVGRLSKEKGIMVLLSAWKILQQDSALPEQARLLIIGDGPLEQEIRARIAEEQISGVELLGRKHYQEVWQYMRRAVALVYPSELYETFGKSIIEAFACGTPVIASDIGAMREVVTHGKTGLSVPHSEPVALAEAMKTMLCDTLFRERLAHAAREEYEKKYTAEHNVHALRCVYEMLCKSS